MVERIGFGSPGVPAYQQDAGFSQVELLIGDVPPNGAPVDLPCAAAAQFALYSVVGQVGNVATGALALATKDGTVKAIGVLMVPVNLPAGKTGTARVHTSGHFNANALVFDASFDSFAAKKAAFTPGTSNVLIDRNPYDPVFTA